MKLAALSICGILALSQFAQAQGMVIKKAGMKADEAIAKEVALVKAECGNASFKATADYAAVEKMTDLAKEEKREMVNMIENTGSTVANYLSHLRSLCKDKDYKAEVAKLTELKFAPDEKLGKKAKYKKEGSVVTVTAGPVSYPDTFAVEGEFKKLF